MPSRPGLETDRDKAVVLMNVAFDRLRASGSSEDFFALANLVGATRFGTFFGSFGGEYGVYLEIKVPENINVSSVLELSFGVRRLKQPFLKRLCAAWSSAWAAILGHQPSYTIRLPSSDVTKFKDMLRSLDQWA